MASKKRSSNKEAAAPEFSLDPLREKLDKCQQLAGWVEAAHEHREEFPPEVVHTVIGDYLTQYAGMVPELEQLSDEAAAERAKQADRAAELESAKESIEAQIDEFKLRHVIGELTKDDFEAKEKEARGSFDEKALEATQTATKEIDDLLSAIGDVQGRIQAIPDPNADPPAAEEIPPPADAPPVEEAPPPPPAPAADELGEAAYNAGGEVQDEWDVEPPPSEDAPAAADDGWNGGGEPAAADEPSPETATAGGEGEDLMATGVIQAQPGIAESGGPGAAPPVHSTSEFTGGDAAPPPGEGPRLAVTPPDGEQVIYPFSGDVMSLGRGRNNDIQIKKDGKISRYHCRIFRRGDEFIVEDNKSSNGTLVDGKLVTRQRLEGGEVVQLGETRVQFFAS